MKIRNVKSALDSPDVIIEIASEYDEDTLAFLEENKFQLAAIALLNKGLITTIEFYSLRGRITNVENKIFEAIRNSNSTWKMSSIKYIKNYYWELHED